MNSRIYEFVFGRIKEQQNNRIKKKMQKKKMEKIDLNDIGKKKAKIGRNFYIRRELEGQLNTIAHKTNNTKSDLIEIAIKMLQENSKY